MAMMLFQKSCYFTKKLKLELDNKYDEVKNLFFMLKNKLSLLLLQV